MGGGDWPAVLPYKVGIPFIEREGFVDVALVDSKEVSIQNVPTADVDTIGVGRYVGETRFVDVPNRLKWALDITNPHAPVPVYPPELVASMRPVVPPAPSPTDRELRQGVEYAAIAVTGAAVGGAVSAVVGWALSGGRRRKR
jgi:hypothetical protein